MSEYEKGAPSEGDIESLASYEDVNVYITTELEKIIESYFDSVGFHLYIIRVKRARRPYCSHSRRRGYMVRRE